MNNEAGKRIIREYVMRLAFPAGEVFPFLCPVREYDWIPQWRCRLVYSASGYAELGCVFQTDFDDQYGLETWVVSRYEKDNGIAFVRTGEHRTTRYTISLTADDETTTLLWHQELTSLSARGDELLAHASSTEFTGMMQQLEQLLAGYLNNQKGLGKDASHGR